MNLESREPQPRFGPPFRLFLLLAFLSAILGPGASFQRGTANAEGKAARIPQDQGSHGRVVEIDVRALEDLMKMDPNLYLVDVRTKPELSGPFGHIPRAIHVPLNKVREDPKQFPKGKTLVFICRSGHRSLIAAKLVAAQGKVAYSVKGGMRAWNHRNQAGTRKKAETTGGERSKQAPQVLQEEKREGSPKAPEAQEDMGC